jgi:HEPN domain-containing protein
MNPAPISPLDRVLNDFATRCFRDVADGDYIAARLAWRAQLFPQFLWSAQQALEKYLKCILLLNRIPARNVGHDLSKALALLESHKAFTFRLSPETLKFIEYVDSVGRYRYFEASYYLRDFEILQLDKAVWEIRRYAECHDYWLQAFGKLVHMLPFGLAKIQEAENAPPARFVGVDGELEKIIADRKRAAREALLWQNAYFGTRARKMVRLVRHLHGSNSPLFLHPEILDEVQQYVLIPKAVEAAYRELAAELAAGKRTPRSKKAERR